MPAGGMMTAAIAAPLVGGILGGISASSGRKAAAAAAAQAMAQLQAIGMPPDLSREIILKQYQSQGVLTPELQQDINLQASNVGQIQEDPSLKSAQMESLGMLGQSARGGLTSADRAAYNQMRQSTQRDSEAKRQQIMQQMQARGQGGSGAELMAQLQSGQAAADESSAQGDRIAATASQNALQALRDRASLAGSVRGQDFSVNQARAEAEDQRNRFLFQNSATQQAANVAALNDARRANLNREQSVGDRNVSLANSESERQVNAKRDYFRDNLDLATAKSNALNNQATVIQNNANAKSKMFSDLGNAVGQGAAAYGANQRPEAASSNQDPSGIYDLQKRKGQGFA